MHISGTILDFSGAFLAGVMVSLTPCVFPLIPITTAAIAGANVDGSRRRGVFLSVIYVKGLALTYALLAVIAALTGKVFGSIQSSPIFLFVIGLLLLFFALAMLDIVSINAFKFFAVIKPKSAWAVFVMGAASGFMIGPCTAPALGAFLMYVASKQNVVYGAALLFTFAYGVGSTLILAGIVGGVFAGWPKAGVWMVWIKRVCGLVLLGFAVYYFLRCFGVF